MRLTAFVDLDQNAYPGVISLPYTQYCSLHHFHLMMIIRGGGGQVQA
jgi:hypothetical protein